MLDQGSFHVANVAQFLGVDTFVETLEAGLLFFDLAAALLLHLEQELLIAFAPSQLFTEVLLHLAGF